MANNKDFKVKNGIQPTVYHEGLGTVVSGSVGYSLANASYDSVSFSVASQAVTPSDLEFKSDGTKMYILEGITNRVMYQYSLSTAFDITTASYDSVSFSVATQATGGYGLFFKPDGTSFYVADIDTESIYQYDLSTAWDLSTASYASKSFSISSQSTDPRGVSFKADGTKMFVLASGADTVYQYSLSTAWDVSTASYDSVSFSVNTQESFPTSLVFSSNGTKFFVGGNTDSFFEYTLSTAWDLSTASYSGNSLSVLSQESSAYGLRFNSDGTKGFVVGFTNDTVYQYSTALNANTLDLSTGSVFEITPTSDIQINLSNPAASGTVSQATLLLDGVVNGYDLSGAAYDSVSFSVSAQETVPTDATFKTDGTKMYVIGSNGDDVNEYDLSTAWDVSTASYVTAFSVASQETVPTGIEFKSDGTKMYIIGTVSDTVHQYSLSTAWDVSTASYDSITLSVATQMAGPRGLSFKGDGTKLYTMNSVDDTVYQYGLSTAWDVSSGSYDSKSFSVSTQTIEPLGFDLSHDGTSFVVVAGGTDDAFYSYELSTAWDISTASYVTTLPATQDSSQQGVAFGNSGVKMYLIGNGADTIYQYTTGSAYTITYPSTLEWPSGTAPTSPAIGETDVITFSTTDGGTTYQAVQAIDGAS
jgi:sugar lactone lactonase YvrE